MSKNPHAQALGKLGGSKKSPAKAAAARANNDLRWKRYREAKSTQEVVSELPRAGK